MSSADPLTLLAGSTSLYRTVNSGSNWSALGGPFASPISAIGPAKSNSQVIYVGLSQGGVNTTTNSGGSWTAGTGVPTRFVTDFAVNPVNAAETYATFSGFGTPHVYRTTNSGATWASVSGNLPNTPVNALAVDWRASPATLYAGTDVGVFRSVDGGVTWVDPSVGLPHTVVMDLLIDLPANTLVAATHGRGAFTTPIPAPTPDLSVTSSPMTGLPSPVSVGDPLSYKVVVHNVSGGTASGVQLVDTLPSGVVFQSAAASQGSCAGSNASVTCSLGSVGASDVTVTVVVAPTTPGSKTNSATVTQSGADPVSGNDSGSVVTSAVGLACTVFGTAGNDTALAGTTGNDVICGFGGNDTIHANAGADTIYAGAGNDLVFGEAGTDTLVGGPGDDTLDGGTELDTVDVSDALAGVAVNLLGGNEMFCNNASACGLGYDTLADNTIENVTGSVYGDAIVGDASANVIIAGAGNDAVDAQAGADTVRGDDGNDTLAGGLGTDTLSYTTATSAVTIDLALTTAQSTGGAGTDTLNGFENIVGSNYADTLRGDGAVNVLNGGSGNDTLDGGNGTDTVTYAGSTAGVTINMATGVGDIFSSIETLIGSPYADSLTGTSSNESISGNTGNDTVYGGSGADTLHGNAGNDTLNGQPGNDTIYGDLGYDTLNGGDGTDHCSLGGSGTDGGTKTLCE
jgi:uncharacterized repeat protein (TIGR01451 family)